MTQLTENKSPAPVLIANKTRLSGQKTEGPSAGAQITLILELSGGVHVLL
jgi:hypothetical protein